MQEVDVVGVGNAMVDVLASVSDEMVETESLVKGSMTLIEADRAARLYEMVDNAVKASGGSAANTVAGVASFGGTAAYIGKVADDELGHFFAQDMKSLGVEFDQVPAGGGPATGMCVVLVTPDAQRTMNTYLGVSSLLDPTDVADETVGRAKYLFCEGYIWDTDSAKQAVRKAMEIAIDRGRKVALTLSDTFCIERHHQEFSDLVAGPVDVVFANRNELQTLYGCDLDDAVSRVAQEVELAFVTLSGDGSLVVSGDQIIEVPALEVDVVDTTGAGDQYAAGALYGLARGLPLAEAGRLGTLAAAEVISHMGPRPQRALSELLG